MKMAAIATFGLALADIVEQAKLDIDPFTSAHLRGVHGLWAITKSPIHWAEIDTHHHALEVLRALGKWRKYANKKYA